MNNVVYQIEKIPENFNELRFLPVLNEGEQRRYQTITDELTRRQFLFSRFILKNKLFEVLSRNSNEIVFEFNDYGKPFLPSQDRMFFNLSHSGNYVGYILAKKEVGLDIQAQREFKNIEGLIKKICHKNEVDILSENQIEKFTKLWTLKEAFSKCTGKGIQENFASIDFSKLLELDSFSSEYIEVNGNLFECEFTILERSVPLFVSAFKMQ